MKKVILSIIVVATLFAVKSFAGISGDLVERFKDYYKPATPHKGLEFAYTDPDPTKVDGFVTIRGSGIPAQRADYFLNWDSYDYRNVIIDGDDIKTRPGKPYTYIRPDTVMIVVDIKKEGSAIYFKLLSKDIYVPEDKADKKHFSRVSVNLGIKFPRKMVEMSDFEGMKSIVDKWFTPTNAYIERKVTIKKKASVDKEETPLKVETPVIKSIPPKSQPVKPAASEPYSSDDSSK